MLRFKKRKNEEHYLEMDRGTYLNGKPTPTCNGCRSWAGGSVVENMWARGKVRLLTGANLTRSVDQIGKYLNVYI